MKLISSLILTFLLAITAAAQEKHTPSLDESLSLRLIDYAKISPDGKLVAYGVRQTNWKDNEYSSQIWIADVASGKSYQLTRGKKSAGQPEWSPDSQWLVFVTERETAAIEPLAEVKKEEKKDEKKEEKSEKGKEADGGGKPAARQIWIISPSGGEAWQLTKSESDIDGFLWSKDGKHIAFTANEPEPKVSKDRKEKYSDYDVFEKDFRQNQLWLVGIATAAKDSLPVAATKLTSDPSLNIGSFSWSPDSARIAFSATKNPLLSFSGESDIYLLDLTKNNAVVKIIALPGPDRAPVFSPDGKQLAFSTSLGEPYFYYANGHIAVVDVDTVLGKPAISAADVRDLTGKFDEDPDLVGWGQDGIYFDALQKTSGHLFRLNPATREIHRVTAPDAFMLADISLTPDGKSAALITEDSTHIGELFVSQLDAFATKKLTDFTAQTKDWKLGTSEVVSWKSKDGATIEGILRKPADYDPGKKYPLLVMIHGGPTGISRPTLAASSYAYPVQVFLARGALVLEPNYRGSAGYGEAFRALNVRNLGVGDMWDVMSGVDSLIAKSIVDADKMGSMGWSQGGYISAFLTTHTTRFKAISVGAGISDWMTYYVSTDITPFTRQYLHATPWDDPEVYAKTSPITTIRQAKTPTLIQSGSNDHRVPVPDAFELYRGLQDQNVPSRLILYAGFGHGVNKPKSQRALLQSNLDWFNLYIWGDPIPKDSPLNGASELEVAK